MIFHIKITKTTEDNYSVTYAYTGGADHRGLLKIDKETGKTELLESSPGDEHGHFYSRAAAKLRKEWSAGRFPDKTEWAS